MCHRRAGNNSVAQRHPPPLSQPDSPLQHGIGQRQHLSCIEESLIAPGTVALLHSGGGNRGLRWC